MKTKKGTAVLVTTEFRGVFFGLVDDASNLPNEITLTGVRNCIYWHDSVRGVFGLAASGPSQKCKIGPACERMTLWKITSVTACSDDAKAKWLAHE